MEITIKGKPEEISALLLSIQGHDASQAVMISAADIAKYLNNSFGTHGKQLLMI